MFDSRRRGFFVKEIVFYLKIVDINSCSILFEQVIIDILTDGIPDFGFEFGYSLVLVDEFLKMTSALARSSGFDIIG